MPPTARGGALTLGVLCTASLLAACCGFFFLGENRGVLNSKYSTAQVGVCFSRGEITVILRCLEIEG